jgi:hypothetical protein
MVALVSSGFVLGAFLGALVVLDLVAAFAAIALFRFFMGILLNEGLRVFTKTG